MENSIKNINSIIEDSDILNEKTLTWYTFLPCFEGLDLECLYTIKSNMFVFFDEEDTSSEEEGTAHLGLIIIEDTVNKDEDIKIRYFLENLLFHGELVQKITVSNPNKETEKIHLFVLDTSELQEALLEFLQGKFSKIPREIRIKRLSNIQYSELKQREGSFEEDLEVAKFKSIDRALNATKSDFESMAETLGVDPSMLFEIGEIMSKPDPKKEFFTLIKSNHITETANNLITPLN